jgi:prepilin-type N-terminal cleavage/methylation domain-containing protein
MPAMLRVTESSSGAALPSQTARGCARAADRRGFTIIEVMAAATILVLVISTSLVVLQRGMRAVDTARNMTLASQISQSELEVLRLQNWPQIAALPAFAVVNISDAISSGVSSTLDETLNAMTSRFTCTRTVTDPKANMRLITVNVTWQGNDGRSHSITAESRYSRNGINDYIYISH